MTDEIRKKIDLEIEEAKRDEARAIADKARAEVIHENEKIEKTRAETIKTHA